jgi:hypothetical protein
MFPISATVLLWCWMCTYFDLWPVLWQTVTVHPEYEEDSDEEEEVCNNNSNEEVCNNNSKDEETSVDVISQEEEDLEDEEEDLEEESDECELDYWEMAHHNLVTANCETNSYYAGYQPCARNIDGICIASHPGKQLIDTITSKVLQIKWHPVPRLSRFVLVTRDTETLFRITTNVRKLERLYKYEPSLAAILPSWYSIPLFQTLTTTECIRQAVNESSEGLRHLCNEEKESDSCGFDTAPLTIVMSTSYLPCVTNWRLHELWCFRGKTEWYILRTFVSAGRVYFYISLFLDDSSVWTKDDLSGDLLKDWRDVAHQMVLAKCDYLDEAVQDGHVDLSSLELTYSNIWSLIRVP